MALARLGVRKIILLDRDVVDQSNLNRQMLFMPEDVNMDKTERGKYRLETAHKVRPDMQIECHQVDALTHWQDIVSIMAREGEEKVSVVFNMIDVGDIFDVAVQSLCQRFGGVPYVEGGTFGHSLNLCIFKEGDGCIVCTGRAGKKARENQDKILPSVICDQPDLNWIEVDPHPVSATNIYLCLITTQMMVAKWANTLLDDEDGQFAKMNEQ